jgi:glycosyltransferase involved in cell wall biosynthesis
MNPEISVIIPTHNRALLVKKAVQSVQNQTVRDLEIIVIDDASIDETPQVLKDLQSKDSRIKVIRNNITRGGSGARNSGISLAQGKWIAFLDDDDTWLAEKLEKQMNLLETNPDAIACTSSFIAHLPFGRSRLFIPPPEINLKQLLYGNVVGGASVCVCLREAVDKAGGFDERLKSGQDWDLWIRLVQIGKFIPYPGVLVDYDSILEMRISTSPHSRYFGHRSIYFKHKHLMDEKTRNFNLGMLCCRRAQLPEREIRCRIKDFVLSIKRVSLNKKLRFIRISLPGIIRDFIKRLFGAKKHLLDKPLKIS